MMSSLLLSLTAAAESSPDPVGLALHLELDRAIAAWSEAPPEDAQGPLYWLGLRATEARTHRLVARDGTIDTDQEQRTRSLFVLPRVGDRQVDNTHPLRESWSWSWNPQQYLPTDDIDDALRASVWSATDAAIRSAQQAYAGVVANRSIRVDETDTSPDFSTDASAQATLAIPTWSVPADRYRTSLIDASEVLDGDPRIYDSEVGLESDLHTTWITDSEGGRIRQSRRSYRLWAMATAIADDGMRVSLYRWKDVASSEALPAPGVLGDWAAVLRRDVLSLREAPQAEPYTGPVLLRGRAAAVFVHEVIGHRVEGHRQKNEDEGATFRDMVGKRVVAPFVSIWDDPTLTHMAGEDLNGHYAYDEEGQPGRRAEIVTDGVFRGFLMSRSPVKGFPASNGHGRAEPGETPVARMANTVLTTTRPTPYADLRKQLVEEARKQGLPYGLLVDELEGGFTLTGRVAPNSFNVLASTVWRVWVDGRPDELVRGVDIIGTPLQALTNLVATGDDPGVFNGWCGAESGSVPNSAVSPSLLISRLEVQRKAKEQEKPTLLPKPSATGSSAQLGGVR